MGTYSPSVEASPALAPSRRPEAPYQLCPDESLYFRRVFDAYRYGITKKKTPPDQSPPKPSRSLPWNSLEFHASIGLTTPAQRKLYRLAGSASYKGLVAAREKRFAQSRSHFETAWEVWGRMEDGPTRWLATSALESNHSYLEYKLGNSFGARERLENALSACLVLECEFDLSMFQMHRIQIGHNIARMLWMRDQLRDAVELCGQMISYLEGSIDTLPFHHSWYPLRIQNVPRSLVTAMMLQVAEEALFMLTTRGTTQEWESFLGQLDETLKSRQARYLPTPAQQYLTAAVARIAGDFETYFENLHNALLAGPRQLSTMFYTIALDFAYTLRQAATPLATNIFRTIQLDSSKWKGETFQYIRAVREMAPKVPLAQQLH